ncbi:MAG: DUF3040 domain-containing protein [Actinobacteria bacterium]|nr:DUF3040 domain-containing protein [Actinomycetota bacterium]
MPLSEHEERMLQEIARQLSEEDPKFVATVANTTPARLHLRRLRWSVIGFLVGLVTLLGLTFHLVLGMVGFALMFTSVLVGAGAVRGLGSGPGGVIDELRRAFVRRRR